MKKEFFIKFDFNISTLHWSKQMKKVTNCICITAVLPKAYLSGILVCVSTFAAAAPVVTSPSTYVTLHHLHRHLSTPTSLSSLLLCGYFFSFAFVLVLHSCYTWLATPRHKSNDDTEHSQDYSFRRHHSMSKKHESLRHRFRHRVSANVVQSHRSMIQHECYS